MAKRIVLCFDGTWNKPNTGGSTDLDDIKVNAAAGVETNVSRFHRSVLTGLHEGMQQVKWYDKGVGTDWYNRVRGGLFGTGLSHNIRQGYKALSDTYDDGDAVFILGFSRGAYTARSLVGMVRNCGLLPKGSLADDDPDDNPVLMDAYALYRTRDGTADSESALRFRETHKSRIIPIEFLGVWDTVGALGVPVESFSDFNKDLFQFHDTELSSIVRNAFHAVAVDEHRKPYAVTLWDPRKKPEQTVEQRWFVGAHADVGGGYKDRRLSDITLAWMQDKARGLGLALDPPHVPQVEPEQNILGRVADSFSEFLGGVFRFIDTRYYRPIRSTAYGEECVDPTVTSRREKDLNYRPRNPGIDPP